MQPTQPMQVTQQYVDSQKPLITIRAQEIGPLNRGQYEWSFGSGDYTPANCGYCPPASGRNTWLATFLRGGLVSGSGNRGYPSFRQNIPFIYETSGKVG